MNTPIQNHIYTDTKTTKLKKKKNIHHREINLFYSKSKIQYVLIMLKRTMDLFMARFRTERK